MEIIESNFNRDLGTEKILSQFFDQKIYSKLVNNGVIDKIQRIDFENNKDWQYQGIDVCITSKMFGLENALIDEKAMSTYMTNPFPTFALELSFINNKNDIVEGWFLDNSKATQYYLFQWIKAPSNDISSIEDVEDVKFCLVEKKKIVDYLTASGYSIEHLQKRADEIRQSGISGQLDKIVGKPFWFNFNNKLREQPINLVIKDEIYFQLATFKYIGSRYFNNDKYRLNK